MADLYDTGARSGTHTCTRAQMHTHTHISGATRMDQPAKTGSNVSHLMSTPLTRHSTLQCYTHTHTLMCLNRLELYPNQVESITQRLLFLGPDNLIWFWFLTLWIEYDKNVFNFNLIYFPLCPRCLDCSFCSGNMPGISSMCYPSFPIRRRPEVCTGRAGFWRSSMA